MDSKLVLGAGLLVAMLAVPAARAYDTDLHWLWDNRCEFCHGHAGEFSRKFLSVSNGQLQGPHHSDDFHLFLRNPYLADNYDRV